MSLLLPATAGAATPGALSRYSNGTYHWATTGPVSSGYTLEETLGFLAPTNVAGTVALYGCSEGSDHFLSLSSTCEGQTVLSTEGYIYTSVPAGQASAPVYACVDESATSEDHFASNDPNCEGQTVIGLLGYALQSGALDRYNGGYHWVTTGSVPAGYNLEGVLGFLVTGGSGTVPLYGCMAGTSEEFLSPDSDCGGQTMLGLEGWIYVQPPAGLAVSPIYLCSDGSDYFAATDPNCEGQVTDELLGYALQQPLSPPSATVVPGPTTTPVTTTIPQPIATSHGRPLRVKLDLRWTWRRASTRLVSVRIGRVPGSVRIRISCRGRGAGCSHAVPVARRRSVRHLIRVLSGRVYQAGDRIAVTLTARGYASERAQIDIRYGKLPTVRLL